jgi:hypothetical protein
MRRTLFPCLLMLSVVAATARASNDARADYPLDTVPRELPPDVRRPRCDRDVLVRYRGTALRFQSAVEMHPDFVPYVQRLERIVNEVAVAEFGRAPRVLRHHGSFNCRTIRGSHGVLSEHAFGNALDVRGFDFHRARADEPLPDGVPSQMARGFAVRVDEHWDAAPGSRFAPHAAFLHALCARLVGERDLFRVMLGPSYPGHKNHLHFDRSPIEYVQF